MVNSRVRNTDHKMPSKYTFYCTLGEKAVKEYVQLKQIFIRKSISVRSEEQYFFKCRTVGCKFKVYIKRTEDGNFDVHEAGKHNHPKKKSAGGASSKSAKIPKTGKSGIRKDGKGKKGEIKP